MARQAKTAQAPDKKEAAALRRAVEISAEDDGKGWHLRLRYAMRVRTARDHRPLTIEVLAVEIGVQRQTVARYMARQNEPSVHSFARLAKALRCGGGWLVFGGTYGRPNLT